MDVDTAFEGLATLSGAGSQGERSRRFLELAAAATEPEQHLLAALVAGELRQGALESLVTDALAKATGLPPPTYGER